MSLASDWTGCVAAVLLVNVFPAGAGGVQAVDHVAGVNVRQSLARDDLDVDSTGASEMVLQIALAAFTNMNVCHLPGLSFLLIVSVVKFPLSTIGSFTRGGIARFLCQVMFANFVWSRPWIAGAAGG